MKKELLSVVILLTILVAVYQLEYSYESRVNKLYKEVLKDFSEIRGYRLDENNVSLRVVTRGWVLERWGAEKVERDTPDYLKNEELFLKSLMLVKENFSYYKRKNKEIAGFMAFSWMGDVYVVKENFDPEYQGAGEALVHELEHVIQKNYFNIKGDGTYDGDKATGAIIEGDAVLAGRLYAGKNISEINEYEIDEDNVLNFIYLFPYNYGVRYLARYYEKGGYSLVDEVLRNPPSTTEQIIHFVNDSFELVENDVFSGELIKKDRLGELFVFSFLASHINDSKAWIAAEGWNGDSYVLYKNCTDVEFRWQWIILFDSEEDALEFLTVLNEVMQKIAEKEDSHWITDRGYIKQKISIAISGNEVRIEGMGLNGIGKKLY